MLAGVRRKLERTTEPLGKNPLTLLCSLSKHQRKRAGKLPDPFHWSIENIESLRNLQKEVQPPLSNTDRLILF
jgi:hypothetical protein